MAVWRQPSSARYPSGQRSAVTSSSDRERCAVTQEDEGLRKRLAEREQKALERIRRERESDLLLPPEELLKKRFHLPTTLAAADKVDGPSYPFVTVVNQYGLRMIMDYEAFDYMYGELNLRNPAQRDLDEMLSRVVRIRVLAGGMLYGKPMETRVLIDTDDAEAVTSLRTCMRIVEEPSSFGHCMCLGCPTVELYSSEGLIGTIGIHHGRSIRWRKWKHDAVLQNGERLISWLTDRKVSPESMQLCRPED
jgi:hypothetical protein